MHGYAGIGAKRLMFKEDGFPDAEPLSAELFMGIELHRFFDLEMHIAVPVQDDKYSAPLSASIHDYLDRQFDLQSQGSATIKTDVPLYAAFFAKPKVELGPVELYLQAGVAYNKLQRNVNGTFDVLVTETDGSTAAYSGVPFEVQSEREAISLAYGAGVAIHLGRLRINGEYSRLEKSDATNHACHTTGFSGTTGVVYCDALFGDNRLDSATLGLSMAF